MTFLELAELILKEEEKWLTANEIWNIAIKKEYDKQIKEQGKTPWSMLGATISLNSKDNPQSIFSKTDSIPKKFYLKSMKSKINPKDDSLPDDVSS